jgi:hypothetical protein
MMLRSARTKLRTMSTAEFCQFHNSAVSCATCNFCANMMLRGACTKLHTMSTAEFCQFHNSAVSCASLPELIFDITSIKRFALPSRSSSKYLAIPLLFTYILYRYLNRCGKICHTCINVTGCGFFW